MLHCHRWGNVGSVFRGLALVPVFFFVLSVFFVLFDGFEGELDLAVEGGKIGFELFELVFLFPRFFDDFLKDGNVL